MTRAVIVMTTILTGAIAIAIAIATVDFSTLRLKDDLELAGLRSARPTQDLAPNATTAEQYAPREAGPGCEWIPMSGHGINFSALYCGDRRNFTRLVPVEDGFAVETELGLSDLPRIEIFRKDPGQSVEDAIAEQILSELTGSAVDGCIVETFAPAGVPPSQGAIRYAITTTGELRDLWEKRFAEDPSYHPCGFYGPKESIAYFESSSVAPDKFVYLTIGQDAPPFEERVIKFIDEMGLRDECETNGGSWLSIYNECEYSSGSWCRGNEGDYLECESACRHELNAQICTLQCVPVCKF